MSGRSDGRTSAAIAAIAAIASNHQGSQQQCKRKMESQGGEPRVNRTVVGRRVLEELLVSSSELTAGGPTERAGHCTKRPVRISYKPEM